MAIRDADIALSITDLKKSIESRKTDIIEDTTIIKEKIIVADKQTIIEVNGEVYEIFCPNDSFTEHFRNNGVFLAPNYIGLEAWYKFEDNADDSSGNGNDGTIYGDNLVGHYKLNGDATDSSQSGNNGTWTGTEQYTTGHIEGTQVADFQNSTDGIVTGTEFESIFQPTGIYAVSCWVNRRASHINSNIWNFGGSGTNRHNLNWSGDSLGFQIYSGSYVGKKVTLDSLNEWVHILCVNNAGSLTLYVNNQEAGVSGNQYAVTSNTNKFYIGYPGNTGNDSRAIDGLVQDVRIMDRIPSDSERADIYNEGLGTLKDVQFFTEGKIGQAMRFDGEDDNVKIDNLDLSGVITTASWHKVPDNTADNAILSATGSTGESLLLQVRSVRINYWGDTNVSSLSFDHGIPTNTWFHIFTETDYTNNTMKIWVNDVLRASTTMTMPDNIINTIYIGQRNGNTRRYLGLCDDVRIINKKLTDDERDAIYNEGLGTQTMPTLSEGDLILEPNEVVYSKTIDYRKYKAYSRIEVTVIGEDLDDLKVYIDYGNGFQDIADLPDDNVNQSDRFDSKFSNNESKGIRLYSVPFENKLRYKLENTGSTTLKVSKLNLRWFYR